MPSLGAGPVHKCTGWLMHMHPIWDVNVTSMPITLVHYQVPSLREFQSARHEWHRQGGYLSGPSRQKAFRVKIEG